MKRDAVLGSIGFFLLALAALVLATAPGQAGKAKAKVDMETYKGVAVGGKFDDVEKKLGRGQRAATKDVPKLADPAMEKMLADALKKVKANLLYKWDNGPDRLVVGIQTAGTGDVVVFKGFFTKEKGKQTGVFSTEK